MHQIRIPAQDRFPLAASHFPAGAPAKGVVLISPATGVKRSLYRRFAEYLAGRGFNAVTWDWRGTGESRPPSLRGFRATMRDWAERDLTGVVDWAAEQHPGLPILTVGHSFGGQALGLTPARDRIRAAVTVAAQSGFWGHWPFPSRYLYAALWHLLMPGLTRVVGWFPAARLGLGEDLPSGVALEWSRWCRTPAYLGDWSGHERFRAPLYVLGFTDDPFAPPRSVMALHDRYGSADQVRRILAPGEASLPRIGHFGFFRPEAARLWEDVGGWLEQQATSQVLFRPG
jgi:predicted alpha/beta hydrolase